MAGTRITVAEWRDVCRKDFAANRRNPKSVVILMLLRSAQWARSQPHSSGRLLYLVVGSGYRLLTEWVLGVEIPTSTSIGSGLRLRHAFGVVINPATVIGEDVLLRHGVTLGNRRAKDDCPVIERGVELGAGAVVIGSVRIGEYARIGAGAVVTKDVPPHGVAYASSTIMGPRVDG